MLPIKLLSMKVKWGHFVIFKDSGQFSFQVPFQTITQGCAFREMRAERKKGGRCEIRVLFPQPILGWQISTRLRKKSDAN